MVLKIQWKGVPGNHFNELIKSLDLLSMVLFLNIGFTLIVGFRLSRKCIGVTSVNGNDYLRVITNMKLFNVLSDK
jgi:hypothetical protein